MGSKDWDTVRARGPAPRALLSLAESFGDGVYTSVPEYYFAHKRDSLISERATQRSVLVGM